MITGDPTRRTKRYPIGLGTQGELRERAAHWSCLRYGTNAQGVRNPPQRSAHDT
jgi:hypothetical protein